MFYYSVELQPAVNKSLIFPPSTLSPNLWCRLYYQETELLFCEAYFLFQTIPFFFLFFSFLSATNNTLWIKHTVEERREKVNIPPLIGSVEQFPWSGRRRRRKKGVGGGGAQSFPQMRTSANVKTKKKRRRWDEDEAGRKSVVKKKKARLHWVSWETVVMRFSSNEGQNMTADVDLILIRESSVCVGVCARVCVC